MYFFSPTMSCVLEKNASEGKVSPAREQFVVLVSGWMDGNCVNCKKYFIDFFLKGNPIAT